MYAIVEIAGQQFKVEKDRKVYVHRLAAEEGAQIEFDSVLLVEKKKNFRKKERSPSISDSDSNRIYQRLSSVE